MLFIGDRPGCEARFARTGALPQELDGGFSLLGLTWTLPSYAAIRIRKATQDNVYVAMYLW